MITSRNEFIEYCLRRLGFPVIEINVDVDQLEDRVDDALQYFIDYHYDGTEKVYFSIKLTQTDIDNGYLTVPSSLQFVTEALPFPKNGSLFSPFNDGSTNFDINYFFGDAFGSVKSTGNKSSVMDQAGNTKSLSLSSYLISQQYLETIKRLFDDSEVPIRFNKHTNRVYLDMNWEKSGLEPDDYIILLGWQALDPEEYIDVYNDRWLKKYATALIKRQWGANLKKFNGIALPGGVQLNADNIFAEAQEEIDKLEDEIQDKYELPIMPRVE